MGFDHAIDSGGNTRQVYCNSMCVNSLLFGVPFVFSGNMFRVCCSLEQTSAPIFYSAELR